MDAIDHNYEPQKIETPTGNPEAWLVGMTWQEGQKLLLQRGMTLRVAINQGVPCAIHADHRPFRWNVAIDGDARIIEVLGRG